MTSNDPAGDHCTSLALLGPWGGHSIVWEETGPSDSPEGAPQEACSGAFPTQEFEANVPNQKP